MKKKQFIIIFLLIIPAICLLRTLIFMHTAKRPYDIRYAENQEYNQKGEYQKMITVYEKLVNKYPDHNDLRYLLGWAYHKTGQSKKGYPLIQEYMRNNPYYPKWQDRYIESIRKAAHNAI